MKKITILFILFLNNVKAQTPYPCVPDTVVMNFLNSQNSYHFRIEFNTRYFDSENITTPKYCFSSKCLSPTAKAKILSLLKGEPYNFEKELDEDKKDFYTTKSINYEIKYTFKGDTTRLAEKLDSLYRPIRAEQLTNKQAEEYSEELIRFVGLIYFHDAIPLLKAELKLPNRYAEIPKQELIKQTLARLGDSYWINYYLQYLAKSPVDYLDMRDKFASASYINNSTCYQKLFTGALNNRDTITLGTSDGKFFSQPTWQWAIDNLTNGRSGFSILQRQKFGKSLLEMYYAQENTNTEAIRKGLLEILAACKYDCLVDYSQKPRK